MNVFLSSSPHGESPQKEPSPSTSDLTPGVAPGSAEEVPPERTRLHLDIVPQPDDVTCGPTCLHAVYRYFGDFMPVSQVVEEIAQLRDGGTLASLLGCHALRRGYKARLYTYDLNTFDPTWTKLDAPALKEKLRLQMAAKPDPKLRAASLAYIEYLDLGGKLLFEDLSRTLIRRPLLKKLPIIAGLSSTYLYREMRDIPSTNEADDIRGMPGGHFVVLHGYDHAKRTVHIADPYGDNPLAGSNGYEAPMDRLMCSILLGIVTYDANLLILEPRRPATRAFHHRNALRSRARPDSVAMPE